MHGTTSHTNAFWYGMGLIAMTETITIALAAAAVIMLGLVASI